MSKTISMVHNIEAVIICRLSPWLRLCADPHLEGNMELITTFLALYHVAHVSHSG